MLTVRASNSTTFQGADGCANGWALSTTQFWVSFSANVSNMVQYWEVRGYTN